MNKKDSAPVAEAASLWTVDEVAKVFRVSPRSVRRMLAAGKLKGRKFGRAWLVTEGSILRFIAEIAEATDANVALDSLTLRSVAGR